MLTTKILEKILLSVVTLHLLIAFHLQHFILMDVTENNTVCVALKTIQVNDAVIHISTITSHQKKVQTNHHVLLADILIIKTDTKAKKPPNIFHNQFLPKSIVV